MHAILISFTGLLVGFTVGLTGMGGGALMTPLLVLLLGVNPLAAVSSDLVTSAFVKPIGAAIHLRRGSVHWGLVGWLCAGSVPAAILGSILLSVLEPTARTEHLVQNVIGATLLIAVAAILAKAVLGRKRPHDTSTEVTDTRVRVIPTIAIGVLGGFVVSVTSVGSGSLIVVLLLFVYPRLHAKQLVSTDLWQAIPLVATAAVGHTLFGYVDFRLVGLLLIGCIPGVVAGSRVSTGASDSVVRSALLIVLVTAGLKMIGVSSVPVLVVLATGATGIVTARLVTKRETAGQVMNAPATEVT